MVNIIIKINSKKIIECLFIKVVVFCWKVRIPIKNVEKNVGYVQGYIYEGGKLKGLQPHFKF